MKRLLLILKVSILLSIVPNSLFAYDAVVDGLCYDLNVTGRTATVTYKFFGGGGYKGQLTIPSFITYNGATYKVTAIGYSAFYKCSGLKGTLTIPNSVTTIGSYAFDSCSGLTGSLTIPNSVTTIGSHAFYGCSGLTGSLTLPSSVTSIGESAFYGCSGFTGSLSIPNSVTFIGWDAFYGCSGFTGSLTISNSVTSVGEHAFYGCIGLTGTLTIPGSVRSIRNGAFKYCKKLDMVVSEIETPFGIDNNVFQGLSSNAVLQVPKGTISKYLTLSGWTEYFQRIEERTTQSIPYTLKITVSDGGSVTYSNATVSNASKSFTVDGGSSVTLTISPINGYRLSSMIVNGTDVTSYVSNNKFTISNISSNTTVSVTFETITHSLTISSSGSGSVTYSGATITNGTSRTFSVNEGTSATLTFTPNSGYRVGSLKVNGTDVTSGISNNKYTISNIKSNTTVSVTFEIITHSLTISSSGSGYVIYSGVTITNGTSKTLSVKEGTSATLAFTPNSGYRVGSLKVNGTDVTSGISDNQYTISDIRSNTTVSVTFEVIPPTTYTLSINSSGGGHVTYSGTTINETMKSFTVNAGTSAVLAITPHNGYRMGSLKVNNIDVTTYVTNYQYVIGNINTNTRVEVTFVEELKSMSVEGVNYGVISYDNKTVKVVSGNYGNVLTVPATFTYQGLTWNVAGIDKGALSGNEKLAAVIWNPIVIFTENVTNPNLLLFVKAAQYAPSDINNVVVNGVAGSITLTEAASGNDFYCPQEFTAQQISYTHNYSMTTGIGECRGWETITLPFNVQTITHSKKGEVVPFGAWGSNDSRRPFWLYELTSSGWREASAIKAYTPYIISMPNNDLYYDEARLSGSVTFSARDVIVGKTIVDAAVYDGKTMMPNFAFKLANDNVYALNVVNNWTTNNGNMTEGSQFVQNLRAVHPFEAYMKTTNNARASFGIFEDMATDIRGIRELIDIKRTKGVYNLKGQKQDTERKLPAGVYIIDGQKMMVK